MRRPLRPRAVMKTTGAPEGPEAGGRGVEWLWHSERVEEEQLEEEEDREVEEEEEE